ncbi:hypothetical protein AB3Y40_06790 [Yoonia sp. R2331]|uniref:phage adaptor protein n=1 Tax=Yoonia sp. R2331 TaxID=3237238 RepID=UPI0034E40216
MATTATLTNREVCKAALRKINVAPQGATPPAEQSAEAVAALNRMLKSWQNQGINLWTEAEVSVTATTGSSHSVSPRPFEVLDVRFRRDGVDIPMQRMTRLEYFNLPNKTTTGTPTTYFVDMQREACTMYVWPILGSVTSETFELTVSREVEDVALDDPVDCPAEFYDAVVYGLAARLIDDYEVESQTAIRIVARAEAEYQMALAHDRQDSVFFMEPGY